MMHLRKFNHSERLVDSLSEQGPQWREVRQELNDLPLTAESWSL